MNVKKSITICIIASFILISLLPASIGNATINDQHENLPLDGMILSVRGGFGVKATISNYQLAWGNRPVRWEMTIAGERVYFGTSSGYIDSMSAGVARSSIFPPTIGFGFVTVTIKVLVRSGTPEEGTISMVQRGGIMIGPFILVI